MADTTALTSYQQNFNKIQVKRKRKEKTNRLQFLKIVFKAPLEDHAVKAFSQVRNGGNFEEKLLRIAQVVGIAIILAN